MKKFDFKPSKCLLDDYQVQSKPINTSTSSSSSSWSALRLDSRLIKNIDLEPHLLHHRIISTILNIHHTELYLPPQSNTTISYLIGIVNLTIINRYQSMQSNNTQINPTTLLISLSSKKLTKLEKKIKTLIDGIEEISFYSINETQLLSETINELQTEQIDLNPNLLLTNLNKLLLLIEKKYINLNKNLKTLTIDLRTEEENLKFNHHLISELKLLLNQIKPNVQLIFIFSLHDQENLSISLLNLINESINKSIQFNLINHLSFNDYDDSILTDDQITVTNTSFNSVSSNLESDFSTPISSFSTESEGLELPKELFT